MVTASILTLGTLMIQEGMLRSARVLDHYASVLRVERFAGEKLWEAKNGLFYSEEPSTGNTGGSFNEHGRDYTWSLTIKPVESAKDLYRVDLGVNWNEGNRTAAYSRTLYAVA
jgi:hypothetical protein